MSIHAEQLHDSQGKVAELMSEPTFYYFAYGSCMCPVDLKRTNKRKYPELCNWSSKTVRLSTAL